MSAQDWISITYLLFYISVFTIIFALMKEVRGGGSAGYVHQQGPATTTVVINQQIPMQPQPQVSTRLTSNYSCHLTFSKCARRRPLQAKYFLILGNIFQYPTQYPAQYPGQGYQPAPQQPPPGYSQQAPYNPGY